MIRKTTSAILMASLVLALVPAGVQAAGGGGVPQGAATVGDSAAAAYNRGLKSRDKAWELTDQLATATGKEREKIQKKIDKEYEKAIRAYRTALKTNPEMYQAHSSLGYALRKTGRYQEALESYDTALGIKPNYLEAIEYRAEAYLGLDRIEEAKEAYMLLFRTDRKHADELMAAMSRWVVERSENPRDLSVAAIEEFAGWVRERGGLAKQTASLAGEPVGSWD